MHLSDEESGEMVEVVDSWEENGQRKMRVRLVSGLEVVRTVKSVALYGQITRADGTVEPRKLLAATHVNPATERRLTDSGVGKVTFPG